jgi:Flp pilus assembly protein TadD
VAVTDHRVPRRPGAPASGARGPAPDAVPLVAFRTGRHAPPLEERERDLGIALSRLALKIPPGAAAVRDRVAGLAIDRLTPSLARWRGDADAWAELAAAHGARGDAAEWLAAATSAAKLAPESEAALFEQASAALAVGRFDEADEVASRLARLNPSAPEYRVLRSAALARPGEWARAEQELRPVLARNPLHAQARLLLAVCRHRQGDAAGGRREAKTAAGLAPDFRQREAMLERYRRETR